MLTSILNSRAFIWILLAFPAIGLSGALFGIGEAREGQSLYEPLLHPTGEFAARFMIIAMIITPLRMMFPGSNFWRWMAKRRRYFGVAAFGYALLHTIYYVLDMGALAPMLDEFWALGIWTGWLAFLIFIPLAMTSNDYSMRVMRSGWKSLQRFVYPAAIATLIHWIFVHNDYGPALVHFVPLAGLEAYRIWKNQTQRKTPVAA